MPVNELPPSSLPLNPAPHQTSDFSPLVSVSPSERLSFTVLSPSLSSSCPSAISDTTTRTFMPRSVAAGVQNDPFVLGGGRRQHEPRGAGEGEPQARGADDRGNSERG